MYRLYAVLVCDVKWDTYYSTEGDRKGPHPTPHRPRPYHDTQRMKPSRPHSKGGGGVEWGGDPCGRPRWILGAKKFNFLLANELVMQARGTSSLS